GCPDHILNKPGRLTEEEYSKVKEHPVIGASILTPIRELEDVSREVKSHHERFDGTGYPEGLKGSDIPIVARIISVCDVFDAITSDRPYRRKMDTKDAISELKAGLGTQFDPVIVGAFLLAYEKGKIMSIEM
ncbi:MAG: HD domain-containing protein, partial [Candidatus Omnitrophica bacterium]|nr:HD domain-containing protein [Candidatus Omnitrophota bacterium]